MLFRSHAAAQESPRETGEDGEAVPKGMECWVKPRNQEGRRGSEEAVPGPSVFPSGEPGEWPGKNSFCGDTVSKLTLSPSPSHVTWDLLLLGGWSTVSRVPGSAPGLLLRSALPALLKLGSKH